MSHFSFGCKFTADYTDEPHGIICFTENGKNGSLIDVDRFHEGFDPSELFPPCPNCNWNRYEANLREEFFNETENPSEQKFKSLVFKMKNAVKLRMEQP